MKFLSAAAVANGKQISVELYENIRIFATSY
jgi:hypothetical protein